MRWLCLIIAFSGMTLNVSAQTFGVGTATPNSNAALHVEAPNNNQGFIMPRLTTAQRTATGFTSLLGTADNGLMVYDKDLSTLFIWDGSSWKSTQQVAQANLATLAIDAQGLVLPYTDSVSTAPANSNLLRLVYNGTGATNVGVAQFENLNPNNGFTTLFVRNQGTNSAGYFQQLNSATPGVALRSITNSNQASGHAFLGLTTGTGGSAGVFQVTNPFNTATAVSITHSGTGNAITANRPIQATQFIGDGSLLTGLPSGGLTLPYIATVANTINNGKALLDINYSGDSSVNLIKLNFSNAASTATANPFSLTHAGVGAAMVVTQTGTTGTGGSFSITNPANTLSAIRGTNLGIGNAGAFAISNATSSAITLTAQTNGTGGAANFSSSNAAATVPALAVNSNSSSTTAAGSVARFSAIGAGRGLTVEATNATSTSSALFSMHTGLGAAGIFQSTNTANTSAPLQVISNSTSGTALQISHSGGGNAINANRPIIVINTTTGASGIFQISNATNPTSALIASSSGTGSAVLATNLGTSSAGTFQVANAANVAAALAASTDGVGPGLSLTTSNATSTAPAIIISRAGTGNAITANGPIQATQFIGDGSLLTGVGGGISLPFTGNSASATNTFEIQNNSATGSKAGRFSINNAANTSYAIEGATNGNGAGVIGISYASGAGVWGESATGPSGRFNVVNPTSASSALEVANNGTGPGISLSIGNAGNTSSAINIGHSGAGAIINASQNSNGTGNGINLTLSNTAALKRGLNVDHQGQQGEAAAFMNSNSSNNNAVLFASTNGNSGGAQAISASTSGAAFAAILGQADGSSGHAGRFAINAVANSSRALDVETFGTGTAGFFTVNNATSGSPAVSINHMGTGNAITANRPIQATQFIGDGSLLTNLPGFSLPYMGATSYTGGALFTIDNSNPGGSAATFNSAAVGSATLNVGSTGWGGIDAANFGTTGLAGMFRINNAANASTALNVTNVNGTGTAATFDILGASNTSSVITINSAGTGNAITANRPIQAPAFIGDGSLLTNLPGGLALPYSQIDASASNSFAITKTSTNGHVAQFTLNNASSGATAVAGIINGMGYGAQFIVNNPSNLSAAVYAETTGGGGAVVGEMTGTGRAGDFRISNSANGWPSVRAQTNGVGPAVDGTTTGAGPAGTFTISNATNASTAFTASTNGTGSVANFGISNASNSSSALIATTNGTGSSLSVNISNAGSSAPAINITHNGPGNAITANKPIQATAFIGDGSGLTNLASSGWGLTGNSGTNPTTNFIGTSDAQDLRLKTNNLARVSITSAGSVGIGTTSPNASSLLHVVSASAVQPVYIQNTNASANQAFTVQSNGQTGILGQGNFFGVNGSTNNSAGAAGVYGSNQGNSNSSFGVYGNTSGSSTAVFGANFSGGLSWPEGGSGVTGYSDYAGGQGGLFLHQSATGTALRTTVGRVGFGRVPTANQLEVEGEVSKTTAGSWLANSDARLKENIFSIQHASAALLRLRPVGFHYNQIFRDKHPDISPTRTYFNFIAQEFQEVWPESVQDDGEGYLQVDIHNVTPYLVAGFQEHHAELTRLQLENDTLKKLLKQLTESVNSLEGKLSTPAAGQPDTTIGTPKTNANVAVGVNSSAYPRSAVETTTSKTGQDQK